MQVETFYPIDKRLKACIEYYYFLKSDDSNFISEYYAFPNTLQALNIHKNISYEINNYVVTVTGSTENNFELLLQGRYEKPLHAKLSGKLNKITIIFKPLGLNHFINSSFDKVSGNYTQPFSEWKNQEKYNDFLVEFFKESDCIKRVEILENYLLLLYHSLDNKNLLEKSLNLLCDFDNELPIAEIADKLNLTTRTFDRVFKQNIGISPVGYRKIARFRHSLTDKLFNEHFERLTTVGYNSNFYDQSYFIKMYKKLTKLSPGKFFKEIDTLADSQLILNFINS